jgi:DnaJ-class molecular chaperone
VNVTTATQVLGLPARGVDRDEVVGAWRRYARAHHPDHCPGDRGAAWRFATGREAFETLIAEVVERPPPAVAAYGRTGVVRGEGAARALPYEMRPLHTREWRA